MSLKGMTKAERLAARTQMYNLARESYVQDWLKEIGSKGGKIAAQNMSPEQRRERAKKAVAAREAKRKAQK